MISSRILILASSLALSAAPTLAQQHEGMKMDSMQGVTGMHEMPATVKAIDAKTGMVDVDAGGMALRLHFPPDALANVKVGDKISVHLGFKKH